MIVFLNGNLVPEEEALVSAFDRGFLYGDGLFETLRVCQGCPFRWEQHWERLQAGADCLRLELPFSSTVLRQAAAELIRRNSAAEATLRFTVSRGVGPRGYSPRGATHPTLIMSVHRAPPLDPLTPPTWNLVTSSVTLFPVGRLGRYKTCNRLPQILARIQADETQADEALLLDPEGHAIEGSASNLFWIQNGRVCTPPLEPGILPGVTRAAVLELCRELNLAAELTSLHPEAMAQTDGVFLSLSSVGIAEAISLDQEPLRQSPLTQRLRAAYLDLVRRECAPP